MPEEIIKEEKVDLDSQVALGLALEVMVATDGWNKIIAPMLGGMQKQYENDILGTRDHIDMIAAQQSINIIDQIFNYVKNGIEIGKGASLKLEESK